MIFLKELTVGFGSRVLLDRVSCTVLKGELCALMGRNGSGKSTLLRAIAGLNNDYKGEIIIDGYDIRTLPVHKRARLLSFVTTRRERVGTLICRDVVSMGRAPYTNWIGALSSDDRDAVDSALEAVGMADYSGRLIDTLSDGEYQRIMIARALAQDTAVILLDEPTSFLDVAGRREISVLLSDIAEKRGKTVIYSTHEVELARASAKSILLLNPPRLYFLSTAVEDTEQKLKETFG